MSGPSSTDWRDTHCVVVDDIEVCVYDHGGADINWTVSDRTDSLIPVGKEHRAPLALALLGAPTPEMIERASTVIWGLQRCADQMQSDPADFADDARAVLNAAFGLPE